MSCYPTSTVFFIIKLERKIYSLQYWCHSLRLVVIQTMITNVKPLEIANAQHFCTASRTLPSPAILYVREVGPHWDYPLVDQLPHQPERGVSSCYRTVAWVTGYCAYNQSITP